MVAPFSAQTRSATSKRSEVSHCTTSAPSALMASTFTLGEV